MNDKIIEETKQRAKLFVQDNFENPRVLDYVIIENAMLIGASIALEVAAKEEHEETLKLMKKTTARDGKPFTMDEQVAYNQGFSVGHSRKTLCEPMGTSRGYYVRGRKKLIFNEGLEDGYSSP